MVLTTPSTSNNMYVSVVIPVYNGEEFLAEAIESVLNQTHREFELILVNDGSTDNSLGIMQSYAKKDPRIRVISHANKGRCLAFNDGVKEAKYEWIARLDADDVYLPDKIEKQLEFIRNNPGVTLLGTRGYHIDGQGRRLGLMGTDGPYSEQEFCDYMHTNSPIFYIFSSVIMKKSAFLDVGGLRKEIQQAEDLDLFNRLSEKGYLLLKIKEPLVLYRVHETSISASKYLEQRMYYKFVRERMIARRQGKSEPTLEEFLQYRKMRPFYFRLNSTRKDYGKYFYRMAALNYANRNYIKAGFFYLASMMLHPDHAVPRLMIQKVLPAFKRAPLHD
jgi:glycosyltransferase involved in cell wall biosynthesis